ncbi:MAG: DegV family protein [Clostridia bacterium]|nr:DegV family protein [Clostridia bacterium]
MSVFFTDTDCEMWFTDAEDLKMNVIGMPYTINGQEAVYDFGKNTNIEEFYSEMRAGKVATTAALNAQDYIDYFEPIFEAGEDIFYVHFSSQLSCTFESMNKAVESLKEKYPDRKFTSFDTLNISLGAGIQAIEACKLHNNGASDEEVLEFLKNFRDKIAIYFYVESLSYLRRGGRISAVSNFMGTLLNLKPILSVTKEGKLEKLTVVKGKKKATDFLFEKFEKEYLDDDKYEVFVLDASNKTVADELAERIRTSGKKVSIRRLPVGPVIGAHSGPGTVGCVFVKA